MTRLPSNADAYREQAARDEERLRLSEEQRAVEAVGRFVAARGDSDVSERMVKALRGQGADCPPAEWLGQLQGMGPEEYQELVGSCRQQEQPQ